MTPPTIASHVHRPDDPILRGEVCPYCSRPTAIADASDIYGPGRDFGKVRMCRPCDAYVGCHAGTDIAKGSVADKATRTARRDAHQAFDPIWRRLVAKGVKKSAARRTAYAWAAKILSKPFDECHIGMFSADECGRLVKAATFMMAEPERFERLQTIGRRHLVELFPPKEPAGKE